MLSVNGVDNSLFVNSNSIKMFPMVSAEWNQNIFNSPYLTVAGVGNKVSASISTGTEVINSNKHPNFQTYSFDTTSFHGIQFDITNSSNKYYKLVTYLTTDSDYPILIESQISTSLDYVFSKTTEINSFGWTKLEMYFNTPSNNNLLYLFLLPSKFNSSDPTANIFNTVPELYETTENDYKYGTVWSTDSVFSGLRPGESYVPTGNAAYSLGSAGAPFPSTYRKVTTDKLMPSGYTDDFYMPVSPITANQNFFYTSNPVPVYKSSLITDVSQYKYFVSDVEQQPSISGFYANPVYTNKLVLKFSTYLATPDIVVTVTKSNGDVITTSTLQPDDNGMLVLYLNNNNFTKNRWSSMPTITSGGDISNYISIKKITVTQVDNPAPRSQFSSASNSSVLEDLNKMQVIEISPRLEVDLTSYVMNVSVNKSLDSKETFMPISSVVTDDASITLSAIPLGDINNPIPIFSNISNYSASKFTGLLRKNVKFYINYNLIEYSDSSNTIQSVNKVIPGGVFYSDSWDQSDIDVVTVQCYDITRYLQSMPASDYVSINKGAFEIITNLLDLTGFTDYDIDSLYKVCNDNNAIINIGYYFCSSKDTTLVDALNQIFLPYQIAAYIDNFGIMRFISLSSILKSSNKSSDIVVSPSNIIQGSYKINNKGKPGKISLRYTEPRLKQSLSLQNIKSPDIKDGPAYIYTTSNDIVWEQQTIDSVGLNFLSSDMPYRQNYFSVNKSDYLDLFHTFNLNNDGYAVIEDEIVSFLYKEYQISKVSNPSVSTTVNVKNDIELATEVDRFIKENDVGFVPNVGIITGGSGDGDKYTYEFSSTPTPDLPYPLTYFKQGDGVTISGTVSSSSNEKEKDSLNCNAIVLSATSSTFTISSQITDTMVSGGIVTKGTDYDVKIAPTGRILNVERGLFGSHARDHKLITGDISASKGLTAKFYDGTTLISGFGTIDTDYHSLIGNTIDNTTLFYPSSANDEGYNTYSTKFNFSNSIPADSASLVSAGLFFNLNPSNPSGSYFLELIRYSSDQKAFKYALVLRKDSTTLAYANVTGLVNVIMNNFQKRYVLNSNPTQKDNSDKYIFFPDPRETFNLRFTKYDYNNADDGEGSDTSPTGKTFSVFLNNFEVQGWQLYVDSDVASTGKNKITGLSKKIILPANEDWTGTKFGCFFSANPTTYIKTSHTIFHDPTASTDFPVPANPVVGPVGYAREIYACEKVLKERSVSYYYQDREFLNGLVQGQRLFNNYKQYIMQTEPSIVGINYYDVQFTNGPAVSVDVAPVEYSWLYFPGNEIVDQQFIQHQVVDEYSLSYSTPINTGFRAKFAVVNNSPHMVYIKKDSDELNNFMVTFSLWTHEAIFTSDPEIIEHVIDNGNVSETIQIDSAFIQSKSAANQVLKMVGHGIENFSKDVSIGIFGNPMVEVGDVLEITYPLMGITHQKYIVHSVSHSYDNGLNTSLTLNMINKGINS